MAYAAVHYVAVSYQEWNWFKSGKVVIAPIEFFMNKQMRRKRNGDHSTLFETIYSGDRDFCLVDQLLLRMLCFDIPKFTQMLGFRRF